MKEKATYANFQNTEKNLIYSHNMALTARLMLDRAFAETDLVISEMMIELHSQCPNVVTRVLLAVERVEDEDNEQESDEILDDKYHKKPVGRKRLTRKYIELTLYFLV